MLDCIMGISKDLLDQTLFTATNAAFLLGFYDHAISSKSHGLRYTCVIFVYLLNILDENPT